MRSAERELLEIERKKQSGDVQSVSAGVKTKSSSTEVLRQRVHEISQQIAEESKRLAATRAQLQRMRKPEQSAERPKNGGYATSTTSCGAGESKINGSGGGEKKGSGASSGRNPSNPVPEELYPELCRYVHQMNTLRYFRLVFTFSCFEGCSRLRDQTVSLKLWKNLSLCTPCLLKDRWN